MTLQIVLLKLKEGIQEEKLKDFAENLQGLKDKISGIISIHPGKNISEEGKNQGYEYGFIIKFENIEARDNYLLHIDHQRIIRDYIKPILADGKDSVLVYGI